MNLDKTQLNSLYRYAASLCGDKDRAYDILHNCVEKYLKRALKAEVSNVKEPIHYLMRSIRNEFIDQERSKKLRLVEPITDEIEHDSLESETLDDLFIRDQKVEDILGHLNPEESELLYLWAVEEYTVQEIADLQQVPKGTLLSRLHRLKIRVRGALSESGEASVTVAQGDSNEK